MRKYQHLSIGRILADGEPCISIAEKEVETINRNLSLIDIDHLQNILTHDSWYLLILLCAEKPIDNRLVEFYESVRRDHYFRFGIFVDSGIDDEVVMVPFESCKRPPPFFRLKKDPLEIDNPLTRLHPIYGNLLNEVISRDFVFQR